MTESKATLPIISEIKIDQLFHLKDVLIQPDEENPHIILTGKNGSGKTQLIRHLFESIGKNLKLVFGINYPSRLQKNYTVGNQGALATFYSGVKGRTNIEYGSSELYRSRGEFLGKISVKSHPSFNQNNFIVSFLEAMRHIQFQVPTGVQKFDSIESDFKNRRTHFVQMLVNIWAERAFATQDDDKEAIAKLDFWVDRFLNFMRELFEDPDLELEFQRKEYNFLIHRSGQVPCGFNELSDGYHALFQIVADVMLQMEAHENEAYDLPGLVFIDEIDAHLHVALQKKVLKLLTTFFPKVQFIVTTHSPFVLMSVDNATVYDLEKRIQVKDLEMYSYQGIIEAYFGVDQYSDEAKKELASYQGLLQQREHSAEDRVALKKLHDRLSKIPRELAPELVQTIQRLKGKYQLVMNADTDKAS
jgi:predicted ATP-binding protein involved in virulence